MMNAINEAMQAVQKAAAEQSEQLMSELNAAADAVNSAQVAFNTEMAAVAKLRADADRKQADAIRAFDTAATQFTAIIVALQHQIGAGEIVTAAEPLPRKRQPKLVVGG